MPFPYDRGRCSATRAVRVKAALRLAPLGLDPALCRGRLVAYMGLQGEARIVKIRFS